MTTKNCINGTITLSRMNFAAYVGHVTIFSQTLTIACGLVVRLELELELDSMLVSGYAYVFIVLSVFIVRFPVIMRAIKGSVIACTPTERC